MYNTVSVYDLDCSAALIEMLAIELYQKSTNVLQCSVRTGMALLQWNVTCVLSALDIHSVHPNQLSVILLRMLLMSLPHCMSDGQVAMLAHVLLLAFAAVVPLRADAVTMLPSCMCSSKISLCIIVCALTCVSCSTEM
jgi:hypothetical protein